MEIRPIFCIKILEREWKEVKKTIKRDNPRKNFGEFASQYMWEKLVQKENRF